MFTSQNDERIDRDISEDLRLILLAIDTTGVAYESVFVTGSFGRGEGTVYFDGLRWRMVNDVDLLVVCDAAVGQFPDKILKDLGCALARSLGVDFVDIGCLPRSALVDLPPTIENFDLKWGSYLLAGRDTRVEIPSFGPGEIAPYELVRLLCNRTAGLLSCNLPKRRDMDDYRSNQYRKACIAVGDIAVYLNQGYHYSYRERFNRFRQLYSAGSLDLCSDAEIEFIDAAYFSKLDGVENYRFHVPEPIMRRMIASAFCAIVNRSTGSPQGNVRQAERALIRYYGIAPTWWDYLDGALCVRLGRSNARMEELRRLILFSLPGFYCRPASERLNTGLSFLKRFWYIPGLVRLPWNTMSAARLWEEYCH